MWVQENSLAIDNVCIAIPYDLSLESLGVLLFQRVEEWVSFRNSVLENYDSNFTYT